VRRTDGRSTGRTNQTTPTNRIDKEPTMAATHAVNPDELMSLGATLKAQIGAVNAIISAVDNPLGSIAWIGPAKEKFTEEWTGNFKNALARLNDAFQAAGTDCERRAEGARMSLG
jgi:uncharacterized protein YukE